MKQIRVEFELADGKTIRLYINGENVTEKTALDLANKGLQKCFSEEREYEASTSAQSPAPASGE
jgi:hypothetical protein